MNKSELISRLAAKTDCNARLADQIVRSFFDHIKEALVQGEKVEIRGFGSFHVKEYEGYEGRNPKTGDPVTVPPKRLPVFRTGKDLRERVNS